MNASIAANAIDVLEKTSEIDGLITSSVGCYTSRTFWAKKGVISHDLENGRASEVEMIRNRFRGMRDSGKTEDVIVVSKTHQYILFICEKCKGSFFYLVLDRQKSNFCLARKKLAELDAMLLN